MVSCNFCIGAISDTSVCNGRETVRDTFDLQDVILELLSDMCISAVLSGREHSHIQLH